MIKILMTAFDPFGGEHENPAAETLRLLPDTIADAQLLRLELPTVFSASGVLLEQALEEHRPDAVLCVGQAGGRAAVTPERVAINLMDASIPDNAGVLMRDTPIRPDGPDAYFSTLPLRAIESRLRSEDIPVLLSCTAGSFVCNCVMYTALDWAARRHPRMRAGFLHVPYSCAQAAQRHPNAPSMELSRMARALICAAEETVRAIRSDRNCSI